jgi:integrase/recombinase XerD
MFESLFSYASVLHRHREGPLAAERAAHLRLLADKGMARSTILRYARYCLCIAEELRRCSLDRPLDAEEIEGLARRWAAERVTSGRASAPRWPAEHFRLAATDFLRSCGRLQPPPARPPGTYDEKLADFIMARQGTRWQSVATCSAALWQVRRFLAYLQQRDVALANVVPSDIDAYFQHVAQRWSRNSLRTCAKMLRAWFVHCEKRAWARAGLARAVLLPRLYRHEGLPIGPTWDEVGRMLNATTGDAPVALRDHAIILLLSVYGLRSGELRRLQLEDIDWAHGRILIVRSKSGQKQSLPLDPQVGNAIVRYLFHGRPKCDSRAVFLTLRAPHGPLSTGGLYNVVQHHLSKVSCPPKGRGPHALRHACARHLIEAGRSLKEVGDHLGHRSPDATRYYVKVNLTSLRTVAFDDLGGLE